MDQVHIIKHKVLVERLSKRQVARELGISRNTIDRYLEGAEPGQRQVVERPRPVWDRVRGRILEILEDSPRWTAGKQRLTAARLHDMLREENIACSYPVVRRIVWEWKRSRREVFIPLLYEAGDLAEVDFFEVFVDLDGKRIKAYMFVMRLMFSSRDFAIIFPRQDQVCFLEGHLRAFEHFEAVPLRILYDNLKPAVAKILRHHRTLTERFQRLVTHYSFEPMFARPATGHDKGGVEARGKGIRLQHLVPIPSASKLEEINANLLSRIDSRIDTAKFEEEKRKMLSLPEKSFDPSRIVYVKASRSALVKLDKAYYSVPSKYACLEITAHVRSLEIVLCAGGESITHPRLVFGKSVNYRHFLRELSKKPNAIRQVAPELLRQLGAPFDAFWNRLVTLHGIHRTSRLFADMLALIESDGEQTVRSRIERAMESGGSPDVMRCSLLREDLIISKDLRGIRVEPSSVREFDSLLEAAQ